MTTILGIDPGNNCGYSLRHSDGTHTSGVWKLTPKKGDHKGKRYADLRVSLGVLLSEYDPDEIVIAYEQSVNQYSASAEVYGGIVGTLAKFAYDIGIPVVTIHWGTIKKFATGKGNATKEMMVAAAHAKWPGVYEREEDWPHDEADARWVAECAAEGLK